MDEEIYLQGIFSELCEVTRDFRFFEAEDEPREATQEERHWRKLFSLITTVRAMAKKRFRQMPMDFRVVNSEDDWIQEAMAILWSKSRNYEPREGYYYDIYMLDIIGKRLTSIQRSIFGKNPPVDEDLRRLIESKRRELKREPTAEEISYLTGISPDDVSRFLSDGVGTTRRVIRESESIDSGEWSGERAGRTCLSPEDAWLEKEFRMIVLECLGVMKPYERYILIQRYFMRRSYPDISKITLELGETARTHCQRAFAHLRNCVLKRYDTGAPE